ncbi:MFS transporter [Oscillatoria sp. FACHB-1406]|uniref:MFS transporter n=1 Tax=Oscillatoria sp. FACHB-1406 TaxID=2692846 RepID=UPI0016841875|nr:MFS transporter [Oscillatoria sp. FACHB-1406]MBD2578795.1 MFS transporter [Oscillatoria sp. FACHB-1406]
MKSKSARSKATWEQKLLKIFNLRPEEGERTLLMFAFYTATSVGMLWLEQATIALFLQKFGAEGLPIIYIASALMGSSLGLLYSWLQNNLALKRVFGIISLLMTIPLIFFRIGFEINAFNGLFAVGTAFALRLWMDAEEILNDLNSQVAANQLFNIREIKRTYPIISSGLLVGDVISGFSLPVIVFLVGLKNTILVAAVTILIGGGLLQFLSRRYKQAFPDTPVREFDELQPDYANRRGNRTLRKYIIPLFAFFILGEILFLLVEFQFFGELETVYSDETKLAAFLGLFSGSLGIFELTAQWFVSSRAVERLGVFVAAMFLPISLSTLGFAIVLLDMSSILELDSAQILFLGAVGLKFFDELLRYTLIAGIEPFLFQPLPAEIRSAVQARVQGIAEPLSTGLTGVSLAAGIWAISHFNLGRPETDLHKIQGGIFIGAIILFSLCWASCAWFLRASYVSLLVQSAEQGRLGFANVDLKAFKRAIIESLDRKTTEEDQRSCVELLARIDPASAGEILAPRLAGFSPGLQRESMEVMLKAPNAAYLGDVQRLLEQKPSLEVLAMALRYVWLSQPELETRTLQPYLHDRVDAIVRGTAAGLIVGRGKPSEKAQALATLETMWRSPRERERTIATQALQNTEADGEVLRRYINDLLQDESARVRCALLEAIAAKRLQDYYPSLIKGLYYKSTRAAAKRSLAALGDEALPLLAALVEDPRKPDFVRSQAGTAIAEIGSDLALNTLVPQVLSSWGTSRRNLLRILLKVAGDRGIEATLERLGRSGIEQLVEQEMLLLAQVFAAFLDFSPKALPGREGDLLRAALEGMQKDIFDRCFLLMQFLYPFNAIQAAIINLDSESENSVALGLEILDNTIDLPQKQVLIRVLERRPIKERIKDLAELMPYQPLSPSDRLRRLLELRHFLSDWSVACCFHAARSQRWPVAKEAILICLTHPSSFVREAVLAYLKEASPRTCLELLPLLKNDPDPLVAAQVDNLNAELGAAS